jgi:hypothetical protein
LTCARGLAERAMQLIEITDFGVRSAAVWLQPRETPLRFALFPMLHLGTAAFYSRGQMRVTRTELIDAHGYDTKFAMHALRLGYQGVEYLRTGRLTLPMTTDREHCMDVRLGRPPLAEVVRSIEELETELCLLTYGTAHMPDPAAARRDHSAGRSPLPASPNRARIDRFLVEVYTEAREELWR